METLSNTEEIIHEAEPTRDITGNIKRAIFCKWRYCKDILPLKVLVAIESRCGGSK